MSATGSLPSLQKACFQTRQVLSLSLNRERQLPPLLDRSRVYHGSPLCRPRGVVGKQKHEKLPGNVRLAHQQLAPCNELVETSRLPRRLFASTHSIEVLHWVAHSLWE